MQATARDLMTSDLITMKPRSSLADLARACISEKISGAPVLDERGEVVGIVSLADLVRHLLESLAADDGGEEPPMGIPLRPLAHVEDVMRSDVLIVAPDAPARAIAERMAAERFHRVLVMEDGKLLGIVTSLDLLAHFATEER